MFFNCQLASPALQAGNIAYNTRLIIALAQKAVEDKKTMLILPELAITGGFTGDLHCTQDMEDQVQHYLQDILLASAAWPKNFVLILGSPYYSEHRCFNAVLAINGGRIIAKSCAVNLPFEQQRVFAAGDRSELEIFLLPVFGPYRPVKVALCVGEDVATWQAQADVDVLVHVAAQVDLPENTALRRLALDNIAALQNSVVLHVNAGLYCPAGTYLTQAYYYANEGGETLIAQEADLLPYLHELYVHGDLEKYSREAHNELFKTAVALSYECSVTADILVARLRSIAKKRADFLKGAHKSDKELKLTACDAYFDLRPPVRRVLDVAPYLYQERTKSPYAAYDSKQSFYEACWRKLATAVLRRLSAVGSQAAVLGLSGGLDSTVALLAIYLAYKMDGRDLDKIYAYQLPGLGSSKKSRNNASALIHILQLQERVISIVAACKQHFADIEQPEQVFDAAYENTQARERTQILMDKANQVNGLVFGTGDLSESALGWCTYNGDQMSMYNLNVSIPKTLMPPMLAALTPLLAKMGIEGLDVQALTDCLNSIMQAQISPELLPLAADGSLQQTTAAGIGSYVLHDFFIYHLLDGDYVKTDLINLAQLAFSSANIAKLQAMAYDYEPKSDVYACRTFAPEEIARVADICLKRLLSQQFKRNAAPDGINITKYNLTAYCRFPADLQANLFLHLK